MSLRILPLLTVLLAFSFCHAANAQDATAALAKISSENPKQPVILSVNFKTSATQTLVIEFTKRFVIDAMQVTARIFTKDGKGIFTWVSLASAIPDDRLLYHARCAFVRSVGSFQYSPEMTKSVKIELGGENRWWFDDALIVMTAEEALRFAQNQPTYIRRIVPYGKMSVDRRDLVREEIKTALMSESCITDRRVSIY